MRQQCDLLGLPRATYYYEPLPESAANLALMARIDRTYTDRPYYGSRRMAVVLSTPEEPVNRKRVYRLYREAGLSLRLKRPRRNKAARCNWSRASTRSGVWISSPTRCSMEGSCAC